MAPTFSYATFFGIERPPNYDLSLIESLGRGANAMINACVFHLWDMFAPNFLKVMGLCFLAFCGSPTRLGRFGSPAAALGPPMAYLARKLVWSAWGVTKIHVAGFAVLLTALSIVDSHDYTIDPAERKAARLYALYHSYFLLALIFGRDGRQIVSHSISILSTAAVWQKLTCLGAWIGLFLFMLVQHRSGSICDNIQLLSLWGRKRLRTSCRAFVSSCEKWYMRASSMPPYQYRTLSHGREIRLIKLGRTPKLPGVPKATMIHVDVDNAPLYEAISYTWGKSAPDQLFLVNQSRLMVSPELLDILVSRASRTEERLIWVDFICINQSSEADKAQQIPIMRDIYEQASTTTIWLENLYDSPLAAESLAEIVALARPELSRDLMITLAEHLFHQIDRARFKATRRVLSHRYFSRTWICQEISASREPVFRLGGRAFHWDSIMNMISTITAPHFYSVLLGKEPSAGWDPESFANSKILGYLKEAHSLGWDMPLGHVMSATFRFEASQSEDRIFGVLGLAFQDPEVREVRQHIGKPPKYVFKAAARALLLSSLHSVHLLPLAGIGHFRISEASDLPSWCPDWMSGSSTWSRISTCYFIDGDGMSHTPGNTLPPYAAGGCSKPRIRSGAIPDSILVCGVEIDIITRVSTSHGPFLATSSESAQAADDTLMAHLHQFIVYARALSALSLDFTATPHPKMYQESEDALWRTLVGDRADGCFPAPSVWGVYYRIFLADLATTITPDKAKSRANGTTGVSTDWPALLADLRDRDPPDRHGLPSDQRLFAVSRDFMRCMTMVTTARRFCLTEGGRTGLVPEMAIVGDRVVVLPGFQTPYLLRRVGEDPEGPSRSNPVYKLVGECYIHGVMKGEALISEREITEFTVI